MTNDSITRPLDILVDSRMEQYLFYKTRSNSVLKINVFMDVHHTPFIVTSLVLPMSDKPKNSELSYYLPFFDFLDESTLYGTTNTLLDPTKFLLLSPDVSHTLPQ